MTFVNQVFPGRSYRIQFDSVKWYHMTNCYGTMFGLPDITIIVVGGVVIIVIIALLYWGLTFKGHD